MRAATSSKSAGGSSARQMKIRPATLRTWTGLRPKQLWSNVGGCDSACRSAPSVP